MVQLELWLPFTVTSGAILGLLVIVTRPWARPHLKAGELKVGRWVKLVLISYLDECRADGADPFPSTGGPAAASASGADGSQPPQAMDSQRSKCFVSAMNSVRERLVQESSTLMVVTGLLATVSFSVVQATAASFNSDANLVQTFCDAVGSAQCNNEALENRESAVVPKIIILFALLSFLCSMMQLLVGVIIGVFTVGRTPQTVMRFLLWGEGLSKASLSCFTLSVVSLAVMAVYYVPQIQFELGTENAWPVYWAVFGCTAGFLVLFACLVAQHQTYDHRALNIDQQLLLCLEPFFADWYANIGGRFVLTKPQRTQHWPPLRAYIALHSQQPYPLHSLLLTLIFPLWLLGPLSLVPVVWDVARFRWAEWRQEAAAAALAGQAADVSTGVQILVGPPPRARLSSLKPNKSVVE